MNLAITHRSYRRHLLAGALIAYLAVVAWGVFGPAPGDEIRKAGRGAQKVAEDIGSADSLVRLAYLDQGG